MPDTPKDKTTENKKPERLTLREFWDVSRWVVKMLISVSPRRGYLYISTRVISDLLPLISIYITAKIIDTIISIVQSHGHLEEIYPFLAMMIGVELVRAVVKLIRNLMFQELRNPYQPFMKRTFFEKMHELGIQSLENPKVLNSVSRAQQAFTYDTIHFFRQAIQITTSFISFVVSLVLLATNFPIMVPVIIVAVIPATLYDKEFRKRDWMFYYETTEKRRRAWGTAGFLTAVDSLSEIIASNSKNFLEGIFSEFTDWEIDWSVNLLRKWFVGYDLLYLLTRVSYYFGYVLVISKAIVSKISVGQITFYTRLIDRLGSDLDSFAANLNNLYESSMRYKDSYQLFHTDPAFNDGKKKLPAFDYGPSIEFVNVGFTYPRSEKPVTENLNLKIAPGEKIAIVGHNGAGKTTLARLLARFYLPTSGEILINGVDTRDIKSETLYSNMSLLFQEFNRYGQLTVEENVIVGRGGEKNTEEVIEALKMADAWDFVSKYENGLQQVLSPNYKGGIKPSSGQWQKLAIARFFYRNSPIVIFDEPTAAIDAVSEYNIFNKIYEFFEGKTVIIISHRFSTVRNADRIIVLENGKILEEGSHDELIDQGGYYAQSFRLQAEGYSTEKPTDKPTETSLVK